MLLVDRTPVSPLLGGNLLALLSTVLWASSFPAVDYLLQSWDPFLLTVVRLAGAFACVTVLALLTGRLREARRIPWRDVLLLALFGVAVPVLFIVILGPAIINIQDVMKG